MNDKDENWKKLSIHSEKIGQIIIEYMKHNNLEEEQKETLLFLAYRILDEYYTDEETEPKK
jgi:hypothetical protein